MSPLDSILGIPGLVVQHVERKRDILALPHKQWNGRPLPEEVDPRGPLQAWRRAMEAHVFSSFASLRQQYG